MMSVRRPRQGYSLCVFVWLLLFASLPQQADARPDSRSAIRQFYYRGSKHYKARRYKQALGQFWKAVAHIRRLLKRNPPPPQKARLHRSLGTFYYILGQTYRTLKRFPKAFFLFHRALKHSPPPYVAKKLRREIAHVYPEIQVQLDIGSKPTGALTTLIDSVGQKHIAETPLRMQLPPGPVSITVRKKGYRPFRINLKLPPSGKLSRFFKLRKRSISPPPAPKRRRPSNLATKSTKPNTQPPVRAASPQAGLRVGLLATSIALGLVAGGAGVVMYSLALGEFEHYNQKRGTTRASTEEVVAHFNLANTFQTTSIALAITAGVCLAGAVGFALWRTPRPTPQRQPKIKNADVLLSLGGAK